MTMTGLINVIEFLAYISTVTSLGIWASARAERKANELRRFRR